MPTPQTFELCTIKALKWTISGSRKAGKKGGRNEDAVVTELKAKMTVAIEALFKRQVLASLMIIP